MKTENTEKTTQEVVTQVTAVKKTRTAKETSILTKDFATDVFADSGYTFTFKGDTIRLEDSNTGEKYIVTVRKQGDRAQRDTGYTVDECIMAVFTYSLAGGLLDSKAFSAYAKGKSDVPSVTSIANTCGGWKQCVIAVQKKQASMLLELMNKANS